MPPGIARKLYGNTVLVEELNKMISDSVANYIKDNNLNLFGQPLPLPVKDQHIDIQRPAPYSFEFEVGIMPAFGLPPLDTKVFEKKVLKISDEMMNEEVDRLRSRFGEREYPESIAEEDILIGKFEELNEEGVIKEEGITSSSSFSLRLIKDEVVKQQLMNLKKEESIDFPIKSAFGNDEELVIHSILRTDHHKAEHMSDRFRFTLNNIVRVKKAEINQELFDKIYGAGIVTSEEQMREKIKEELAREYGAVSDRRLDSDIENYLISETQINFPTEYLRRLMNESREDGNTDATDEEFIASVNQLKGELIFERLLKENEIIPEEEELREEARKEVINYFGGKAAFSQNPESLESIVDTLLKEKESLSRMISRVRNEKLFRLLRSKVQTELKEVDANEFFHH